MLLPLPQGCIVGRFLRRLKRFSIEFEYEGQCLWAHTNNSGSMLGLLNPGCEALLSPAPSPQRKLAWTLERIRLPSNAGGYWIGVNTLLPNRILSAAFAKDALDFCKGYANIKREARRGVSRLDAMFDGFDLPRLWVECKNVTLVEDDHAAFPDATSVRGQKHLRELIEIVQSGERAAMFYLLQRPDGKAFAPADYVDPVYASLFYEACKAGVEIYVQRAILRPDGTDLGEMLPVAF